MNTEPKPTPSPNGSETPDALELDGVYIQLRFDPAHREEVLRAVASLAETVGALAASHETTLVEATDLEPTIGLQDILDQALADQELRKHQESFGLLSREQQVMEGLLDGLSIAQIATQLIISPETVKHYLKSIRGKLGGIPGEKHGIVARYNDRYAGPYQPNYLE